MESSTLDDWKRDKATGLWIPDIEKAGLNALKQKPALDPKKYAKRNCKFCNGTGEMRRTIEGDRFKWVICMCVVKRWPYGREPGKELLSMERDIHERKNKGVLK